MEVSNNGILRVSSTGSVNNSYKNIRQGNDSFQKGLHFSSPISLRPSININNLYKPQQLIRAYANKDFVAKLMEKNPKIGEILAEYNIEPQINPQNILKMINSHIATTTKYAMKIADTMGLSNAERKNLEQACVFHDFGKILIPDEILNKNTSLTEREKEIMDLHSVLGYELLSTAGMNEKVLDAVLNHHTQNKDSNSNMLNDILSVADIYSALREERSYKAPFPKEKAIEILDQKAKNGEVSAEVVDALKYNEMEATYAA